MGILRFRIAAREEIIFSTSYVDFLRSSTTTKNISIPYSNGSGQNLVFGDVLYTYLTPGNDGYIEIKSSSNQTLSGTGLMNVDMTHMVSSTQVNQSLNFTYDSSPIIIQVSYNSRPIADDIVKDINNRSIYTFLNTDFTDNYIDYDSDSLAAIAIFGNVDGYLFNGSPYVEGQWIVMSDVSTGNLQYESLSQDPYYEKDNTWKAKDVNGNISN